MARVRVNVTGKGLSRVRVPFWVLSARVWLGLGLLNRTGLVWGLFRVRIRS